MEARKQHQLIVAVVCVLLAHTSCSLPQKSLEQNLIRLNLNTTDISHNGTTSKPTSREDNMTVAEIISDLLDNARLHNDSTHFLIEEQMGSITIEDITDFVKNSSDSGEESAVEEYELVAEPVLTTTAKPATQFVTLSVINLTREDPEAPPTGPTREEYELVDEPDLSTTARPTTQLVTLSVLNLARVDPAALGTAPTRNATEARGSSVDTVAVDVAHNNSVENWNDDNHINKMKIGDGNSGRISKSTTTTQPQNTGRELQDWN